MSKKGGVGVTLLVFLLFVLVILMSVYIVTDKTCLLKNNSSANNDLQEAEDNKEEQQTRATEIVAELFKKERLQEKGVIGCDIKSVTTIDSEENLTIYSINYDIGYNEDYSGAWREADKWTANISNEVLVEKTNGEYKIIQTANGGLRSVQRILVERTFSNYIYSIDGVTNCTIKLCELEKKADDKIIYHIIFDVQSNHIMDIANGDIKENNWVENNNVYAYFSKEKGSYVFVSISLEL